MIFTESLNFISVIAFILVFNLLKYLTPKTKILDLVLLGGSILIISVLTHIQSIAVLAGVSAIVYFTGLYLHRSQDKNKIVLPLIISGLLGFFIAINYKAEQFSIVDRAGLSYILFRLIHFLVDCNKNKIKTFDLLNFLNYILFFPTFLAGPIDRYQNFSYWINQERQRYQVVLIKMGIFKLALGIIKKYLLVPQLAAYATDFSQFSGVLTWQHSLIVSLVIYSFYILFDFSGYSDIAIGTAYLIGVRTPENFNWPYLSKNISIFWKKWHITFSSFLFEYLYKPLVRGLSDHFQKAPRLLISCIGYLITFMACGVWHGNSLNFIFWGLWHAFGLCFYKLIKPYSFAFTNQYYKSAMNGVSIVVTFLFVTGGWFFFNYKTDEIFAIANNFFSSTEGKFSVNTVKYVDQYGYKLNFQPKTNDSLVDIELGTVCKPVVAFHFLQRNERGEYFIIPDKMKQQLYVMKIRSRSSHQSNPWNIQLVYFDSLQRKPNFIQKKLFGNKIKVDSLQSNEENILFQNQLQLPRKLATQKIDVQAHYFEGYGWGVRIFYLPDFLYTVDVEYQYENSKVWETAQSGRPGQYDFCDIHGNLPYRETTRNLLPGKYFIRIRYEYEQKKSSWFEWTATIPIYADGKP